MPAGPFPPAFHPLKQETNWAVLEAARQANVELLLVGGYIRDAVMNRYSEAHPAHDFDYTVMTGSAIAFGKELQGRLGGNFVLLDQELDTCRIVLENGIQIDFAGCMGGTLEADLRRRDLTINALAWSPEKPDEIIDITHGLKDIEQRKIRLISERALIEDPLRLLRVFRFAAALDFEIDSETLELVVRHAKLLDKVAAERISYEVFLILDTPRAGKTVKTMADSGLLEMVFPELSACRNVPKNAFHHLGLFDHSVQALIECESAYPQMPDWAKNTFETSLAHQASRLAATKLASLLHDIGKPATWAVREDGKHTFIGHDKLGAEMIEDTAKRLKWSRPMERVVSSLVRWHLRPGALFHQGPPTERAIYRFYRDVGPELPQLILLAQADFGATKGPGLLEGRELLENQLIELLNGYSVFIEGTKQAPRLLDGRDVMKILGIEPGPVVGELLDELEEARSLGEVINKQQAETFLRDRYNEKYCK